MGRLRRSPAEITYHQINHWQREQAAIQPVQPAPVPRQQISTVLHSRAALDGGFTQVAQLPGEVFVFLLLYSVAFITFSFAITTFVSNGEKKLKRRKFNIGFNYMYTLYRFTGSVVSTTAYYNVLP